MDERPDQIISNIEAHRDELGRNLNELETRVRRTTDWRTYYERNPMLMVGAALGGGVLLGSAIGRRGHRSSDLSASGSSWSIPYAQPGSSSSASSSSSPSRSLGLSSAGVAAASSGYSAPESGSSSKLSSAGSSLKSAMQRSEVSETMEHIKAALIGFGISKAKEFLTQAVPGIDHHLSEAERKHKAQKQGLGSFDTGTSPQSSASESSDLHSSPLHDQSRDFGTGSEWDSSQSSAGSAGFGGSHAEGQGTEQHQPAVTY